MESSNWNCICKQDSRNVNTFDLVKCTSCGTEAHSNCYELYSNDSKKAFLCFRCRIEYNDPFYDLEEPLIKPICFYSSETVNQEIPFTVAPNIYSAIKEKKTHSIIAVFTKIVYDSPKYIEQPNTSISVFINNKPLSINPRQDANLDAYLVEGKNSLGLAANKLPSKCIIGIFLGKRVEVKDIAKRILKLESQPTCEEAKRNFESIRFRELEVLAAFPVRDPITNKMMLFAARGSKCRHLQCFDLINYLKFYQSPTDKYWQCFWCKNIVPWRDLRIDQYVYTILKEIRDKYNKDELEEIENICFDEKGDWKLQQDFSKEWEESFAMNREKRLKEKRERMEVEHNEEETKQQQQMVEETKQPKSELSLEECVNSYNVLQKQFSYLLDSEQINETVATKMRELNSFKNFTPYKIYEFFEKTMMLIGCALPGIFTSNDEKILFYKLEDLAEMVYKKKLNSMAPLIFSWARNYDDLIVLTLLIITRNKRNDPDMALAIELLLCYSWFMETRKISLEGLLKQNMHQLFGKLIHYFGDKLQWKVQEYATLTVIFKKYIPDLHVPGTIPKRFSDESEKIFSQQAEFIVNMLKGFSMSDVLTFLDLVYKPPNEEIQADEDKILRYVFYYFIQIFKKHQPSLTGDEITLNFKKWDKYHKAMPVLESTGIKVSNITEYL